MLFIYYSRPVKQSQFTSNLPSKGKQVTMLDLKPKMEIQIKDSPCVRLFVYGQLYNEDSYLTIANLTY